MRFNIYAPTTPATPRDSDTNTTVNKTSHTLSGTWDFKWDAGTTINVQFKRSPLLNETVLSQQALTYRLEEIMAVANTWVENTSLRFNFSQPLFQASAAATTDYDLLVELAPSGTRPWSLLGQHAQRADYGASTMKLAIPAENDTSALANEQFKPAIICEFFPEQIFNVKEVHNTRI